MRSKFYLFIKFGYSWLPKSNYILWVYKELLSEYIQFIIMKDLYAIRIAKLKSAITTRALTIIKIKAWLSFSILLWSQISWLKNFLLQEIFSSLFQIRNIFPNVLQTQIHAFSFKVELPSSVPAPIQINFN